MKANENEKRGEFTGRGEVRFVRVLPGPIERVWDYLTDSEKRSRWLAAGPLEPRVGGRVELKFKHAALTPHPETPPEKYRDMVEDTSSEPDVAGRVTRCEPPRLLSFTWGGPPEHPSEVTFELVSEGDAVRLVLTHRRLGDDRERIASVSAGWDAHVSMLIAKLAGAALPPFWSTHTRLEAEYAARLAALSTTTAA